MRLRKLQASELEQSVEDLRRQAARAERAYQDLHAEIRDVRQRQVEARHAPGTPISAVIALMGQRYREALRQQEQQLRSRMTRERYRWTRLLRALARSEEQLRMSHAEQELAGRRVDRATRLQRRQHEAMREEESLEGARHQASQSRVANVGKEPVG